MTVAEIKARIWARVDDNPSTPLTCTDAEVLAAINEAQQLFSFLTLCMEKTATISITAATPFFDLLTLAPDFLAPLQLRVAGAKVLPATLADLDVQNSAWQATAGTPTHYVSLGWSLLAVTPQPAITASASFTYAYAPADLAVGDTPVIPEENHEDLVDYGIYRVRLKEGAQGLARGSRHLERFLASAQRRADFVRSRSRSHGYDTLPFELAHFDRARLVGADDD